MKAADWIVSQRQRTRVTDSDGQPVPHYGLLPAGMLEDCQEWRYWYATNAYSYLGLRSVAEAFREAGRPEAAHYAQEAEAYRRDILNSLQRAIELSPVVRLRNNTCVPYVPVRPYQRFPLFRVEKVGLLRPLRKGHPPHPAAVVHARGALRARHAAENRARSTPVRRWPNGYSTTGRTT